MELIDEEGRLFGRVNIVDALVVVFALAVIAAGAALVLGGSGSGDTDPSETMYVTVETTNQSATALSPGPVTYDGADANVTDVYYTPNRAYLRLALDGDRTEDGFQFNREPVRLGANVGVATETASTEGTVVERNTSESFDTETTPITAETTVRSAVAAAVSTGDEQLVEDTTLATVTGIDTMAVNGTHARLTVTLGLQTRLADGMPHYGGRPVRLGRELAVETDSYEFHAEITARE
jgi:hypothetical protein